MRQPAPWLREPGHALRAAFLAILAVLAVHAPSEAQDPESGHLPLWEVTHEDATVYLMGSVHMLRPDVYPLPDPMEEAFDAADQVVFELDFTDLDAAGPEMLARGSYDDGRTLADEIPEDLYDEIQHHVQAQGLPPAAFSGMKPWMVALTLSALVIQQGGYEVDAGLDMHFYERAQEASTPVRALETVDQQIDVFEELGLDAQVAYLRSTVEEVDDLVEQMDELTALWQAGDTEGLAEALTGSLVEHPELEERILYERNEAWVPQVVSFLEEGGTTTVIVGAGHLVGDRSVVDLLEAQGFQVEQESVGAAGGR